MTDARTMGSNRQSGFTLIETVVALSMLAVILTLATAGLRTLGTSASLGARTCVQPPPPPPPPPHTPPPSPRGGGAHARLLGSAAGDPIDAGVAGQRPAR